MVVFALNASPAVRLSTRLLLPLVATVVLVMGIYGAWALREREVTLVAESEREIQAYATALALAVERALRHPELGSPQEVIDRLGREPTVYGVLVYDGAGRPTFSSEAVLTPDPAPDSVLARVLGGEAARLRRTLDDQEIVGVLRPLMDEAGRVSGVLEVAQPLAFLTAEQVRIRRRFLLNTLTLLGALTVLVVWLVRRSISVPLERFVEGVRRLGSGDLGHRIDERSAGGELAEVARELNRMAGGLERAREELLRESEERLSLERRLQQSEKMAAVGTLAAGLAHEIGAPLHVIRGRAELLRTRDPEPATRRRNLGIIVDQIDRITLIVRNLLGYARRREPRPAPTDLAGVLSDVVAFLEDEAARIGATVRVDAPRDGVRIRGDADLLHQVFLNLLVNALHAVESVEGERRVEVELRSVDTARGARAEVEVRDTGPGIPEELRSRIFDPFFTTKEGRKGGAGTGLGLAVALGIVEDHGGWIEADDTGSGGGGRIRVVLPREPAAKEDATGDGAAGGETPTAGDPDGGASREVGRPRVG